MAGLAPSEFLRVSAELGRDPTLVQGAGGNSSLKSDEMILVKASGTKLADALTSDIFVELNLTDARAAVEQGQLDRLKDIALPTLDGHLLRPSIETALHLIMPHACVAHVHALNTITASIQPALSDQIDIALEGLRWTRIPYVMPGEPLARAVHSALKRSQIDVVILDNHGLVVGADTPDLAMALVRDVETRLAPLARRRATKPIEVAADLVEECSRSDQFELIDDAAVQAIAFDPLARAAAVAGTLYPDHAVFLGPGAALRDPGETLVQCADRVQAERGARVRLIITPDAGVAIEGAPNSTDRDMVFCLAEVAFRVQSENLTVLENAEALKLVNWDAEIYRRQINIK